MRAPKLWTAFGFTNWPTDIHCTHKFLGEQTMKNVVTIEGIIDEYFRVQRKFPVLVFDRTELFGANKDIQVMTPSVYDLADLFPDLRVQLDRFRKDDFDGYRPHVTVQTDRPFQDEISHYVLMAGKELVKQWYSI